MACGGGLHLLLKFTTTKLLSLEQNHCPFSSWGNQAETYFPKVLMIILKLDVKDIKNKMKPRDGMHSDCFCLIERCLTNASSLVTHLT